MLRIALPLVIAELGWMTMAIVDTVMVGHLPFSARAIAAVSLGGNLFYLVAMVGAGLLLGLDTVVAQAFGAGRMRKCHRALFTALWLALALAFPLMWAQRAIVAQLSAFGIEREILDLARPFVHSLSWSTLPLLLYFAIRRYLQAL